MDNRSVPSRPGAAHDGDGVPLEHDDNDVSTHNIAHGLHFASIAMLGLLVLEVSQFTRQSVSRKTLNPLMHEVAKMVTQNNGVRRHTGQNCGF